MAPTTHDARWSTEPPGACAFTSTTERSECQTRYLEDLWSVDEEAEAVWHARRGRRIAVRCAGWLCVVGMVAIGARIARTPVVRSEILAWGTMATIKSAGPLVPPPSLPAAEVTPLPPVEQSDAGQPIQFIAPAADAGMQAPLDGGAANTTVTAARGGHALPRAGRATKAAQAPVIAAAPADLIIDDPYDDETPRDRKDDPFVDPYRLP
jgi:hypothetical protein